jgi:hypothetical protein
MNLLAAILVLGLGESAIQLHGKIDGKSAVSFDVTGLDRATLDSLGKDKREKADWNALFSVRVITDKEDAQNPPLLGSYSITDGVLRFEPRFPPARGVRYRAVFDPSKLPGGKAEKPITSDFFEPKPAAKATTVVEHVYPSRDKLPENQLKFYLHFSAPMGKGGSYRHIRLLDAKGRAIEPPFLELDEELWDAEQRRFTLFLDPGRIKRGLKPREEVGPVLEEGKSYTLVVDKSWTDTEGNVLRDSFRKQVTVGPPDNDPIDPDKWKFHTPVTGEGNEREPLTIDFSKPLDHALLHRLIWVTDAAGKKVPGTITVDKEETRWRFHIDGGVWRAGAYRLVVDKSLEDLAGNNVGRPFEVDVFHLVQREVKSETVKLPFIVREPGKPRRP